MKKFLRRIWRLYHGLRLMSSNPKTYEPSIRALAIKGVPDDVKYILRMMRGSRMRSRNSAFPSPKVADIVSGLPEDKKIEFTQKAFADAKETSQKIDDTADRCKQILIQMGLPAWHELLRLAKQPKHQRFTNEIQEILGELAPIVGHEEVQTAIEHPNSMIRRTLLYSLEPSLPQTVSILKSILFENSELSEFAARRLGMECGNAGETVLRKAYTSSEEISKIAFKGLLHCIGAEDFDLLKKADADNKHAASIPMALKRMGDDLSPEQIRESVEMILRSMIGNMFVVRESLVYLSEYRKITIDELFRLLDKYEEEDLQLAAAALSALNEMIGLKTIQIIIDSEKLIEKSLSILEQENTDYTLNFPAIQTFSLLPDERAIPLLARELHQHIHEFYYAHIICNVLLKIAPEQYPDLIKNAYDALILIQESTIQPNDLESYFDLKYEFEHILKIGKVDSISPSDY